MIIYGKRSDPCFLMEKRKEDGEGEKKAVTPRLAFPFCLKIVVKQGRFQKKEELGFYNLGIKVEFLKMFPV